MSTKTVLQDEDILIRCSEDPIYFAEMVLPEPPGPNFKPTNPLVLKWWQKDGLKALIEGKKKLTVRVRRQSGKTILSVVYALWYIAFHENVEILVVAPGQAQVDQWMSRFDHFINYCPFLKSLVASRKSTPHHTIRFLNGSIINLICGGPKGNSIRSKSAQILFVDEADFFEPEAETAYLGIIKPETVVIATTTISGRKTAFRSWCENPSVWHNIHVDPETDPDFTKQEEEEYRKSGMDTARYNREVRCIWDDSDNSVFPRAQVERASKNSWDYEDYTGKRRTLKGPILMGVDWDKYGAGSTLIVIQYDTDPSSPTFGKVVLIYREEIPKSKLSLTRAVDRVVELNLIFDPHMIYCDRGFGEMQIETLQKLGVDKPETKLEGKVEGFAAQQKLEIFNPITGETDKKPLKAYMVARTQLLFEQDKIEINGADNILLDQLLAYEVVDPEREIYTNKNDHCVDALNLAVLAFVQTIDRIEEAPAEPTTGQLKKPELPIETKGLVNAVTGVRSSWTLRDRRSFGGRGVLGTPPYLTRRGL